MKKVVLVGGGKKSLILDMLKKNQNTKEDFKSQNQEKQNNIMSKAKIIIDKNENAFAD